MNVEENCPCQGRPAGWPARDQGEVGADGRRRPSRPGEGGQVTKANTRASWRLPAQLCATLHGPRAAQAKHTGHPTLSGGAGDPEPLVTELQATFLCMPAAAW